MSTAHRLRLLALGVSAALAACDGSDPPTEPSPAREYVLVSVAGRPVPAATDSAFFPSGNRFSRVVGRSIEFLSADSARVAAASDVVERLPDGSLRHWATACATARVVYRRSGQLIVLDLSHAVGTALSAAAFRDTLLLRDGRLAQDHRTGSGSVVPLTYEPGRPSVPVCAPPPP